MMIDFYKFLNRIIKKFTEVFFYVIVDIVMLFLNSYVMRSLSYRANRHISETQKNKKVEVIAFEGDILDCIRL